jgi:hypothetical protein
MNKVRRTRRKEERQRGCVVRICVPMRVSMTIQGFLFSRETILECESVYNTWDMSRKEGWRKEIEGKEREKSKYPVCIQSNGSDGRRENRDKTEENMDH